MWRRKRDGREGVQNRRQREKMKAAKIMRGRIQRRPTLQCFNLFKIVVHDDQLSKKSYRTTTFRIKWVKKLYRMTRNGLAIHHVSCNTYRFPIQQAIHNVMPPRWYVSNDMYHISYDNDYTIKYNRTHFSKETQRIISKEPNEILWVSPNDLRYIPIKLHNELWSHIHENT